MSNLLTDQHGNPVSTTSRRALELYDQAVTQFSIYRIDPLATIEAALEEDPTFIMGHCFKAGLLTSTSERNAELIIATALDSAKRNASRALPRERMHIAAAQAWLRRDFARANKLYGDIVAEYPRDLLAVQVAHLGDFLLGQSTLLRDRIAQALPAWSANDKDYGILLGMYAFGLEETGLYAQAEAKGRRAVELNPADGWGAHAVAHVLEMQGRTEEGIEWLQSTAAGWNEQSMFAYHNWWHLALYHLENESYGEALRLYDECIRPSPTRVALEMVDGSALLWRLHLRSVDVGNRWQELADCWQAFGEEGYYAFNDVHALMAFMLTGRDKEARQVLDALETAAKGTNTNAMMSREVGLPVARALYAFEQGDYGTTIDELLQVRGHAQRFGGSNAQRDLLHLTLVEAALRAGRRQLARGISAERLALKPHSPFNLRLARRANELGAAVASRAA